MRIVQTVFGVFHHFELARELERRGHLGRIDTTWPRSRVSREGLPPGKVATFPWLHMAEMLAHRLPFGNPALSDQLGYWNALAFDQWTTRQLAADYRQGLTVDALIGISGSSLVAGRLVQQHGGKFICDRGSTHQRYQEQIVAEEYARWGVERPVSDIRDTLREEAIYAQADAITVPSSVAARSFVAMGVPATKLHTIPYGVRLDNFKPTGDPPANEFCVLFAGQVGLRKGVPYLLQAFAELEHPAKKLRIIGPMQPELKSILSTFPTTGVDFAGPLPQSELAAEMSRSHVLVLPSIEEGLALVQAQAMACGCPVLCSENTGGEDLFTDGIEGFIVPIRRVDLLKQRLEQLAEQPELQKSMRAAALKRVQTIGGWQQYGDQWETMLRALTAT